MMKEQCLQSFLDMVHANQKANRINFPKWTEIIERIDGCLSERERN